MKKHVFIAISLLAFSAILYGQSEILERKVKIENREGTIESILDEISRKGNFYFSYSQEINQNKKSNCNTAEKPCNSTSMNSLMGKSTVWSLETNY